MCDHCDGNARAVRFPVSVEISNFTDMDQAAYVVLYVSQYWYGKWWQPGYPAILSAITAMNQTLDVCQVPQQFTHAPSLLPTQKPAPEPTRYVRRQLLEGQDEEGEEEEEEGHSFTSLEPEEVATEEEEPEGWEEPSDAREAFAEAQEARRLASVAPKTAASHLDDDFANDDLSMAQLGCCLGSPGQMYIVGCVVRDWPGHKNVGKAVKGPPFDDRCVALSGVCGVTCGASLKAPHTHCEDGIIPQRFLVADYCGTSEDDTDGSGNCGEDTERVDDDYYKMEKALVKREKHYFKVMWWIKGDYGWFSWADIIYDNPAWHWMFMAMMFMAYTSMVLAYIPGIGRCGSSRARLPILHTLNSQGAIKDGVECVSFSISASEHKLWVLRNLVGKCASSFYHPQALLTDFFMDETARSGAYAVWDALSRFVDKDESCQVDMVGFLKAWAARLRDPAELLQETEDRFKTRSTTKKLLSQIEKVVDPFHNIGSLATKYGLTEDDLAELHYAYELYELVDCMLDKRVWTGWDVLHASNERPSTVEPGARLYEWEDGYTGPPTEVRDSRGSDASSAASSYASSSARGSEASSTGSSGTASSSGSSAGSALSSLGASSAGSSNASSAADLLDLDGMGSARSLQRPSGDGKGGAPATMVSTHMSGFRDWLGHGSFSVFMVQWAQSLLELSAATNKSYNKLDPFSSDVLGFAKDDVTNCQVAEELHLFDDGGRFKQAYTETKKWKTHKEHDFVEIKDGRISFFFGTYVSRPLRMIYANRGKPEQREKAQEKKRVLVPGVYACLDGSPQLPALDPSSYYDHSTPSPYPAPYAGRISHWEAYRRCYGLVNRELAPRFFNGRQTKVFEIIRLSDDMVKIQAQLMAKFPQRHKGLDDEDRIELPESWLDPQQRCRGKAGGMNFSVRVLEDRENLELGLGLKTAPPNLKLYSIFDCRHMVTPGFWEQTILHFFRDVGGLVKREASVMYCQVPQNFVGIELKTDYLDMQNEYLFRYVNCIRDGVGAVTSCGTNCVWAIEKGFEFEERTMIEDTATSHKVLLSNYEGTYHYEKLIFGTPKENKDFLAAVFRWSRGAVQLFWLSFFGGSQGKAGPFTFWKILLCTVGFLAAGTFGMLILTDIKILAAYYLLYFILASTGFWFLTTGNFGRLLRYVVLIDNTTYFYGTIPAYFWCLVLPTFMCMSGSIPFDYYYFTLVPGAFFWEVLTWMLVQEVKYWSIVEGKRPREISILRSQQMYFVTTPLHGMATYSGTMSGYRILTKHHDASSWSSFGHGGPGDWVVHWLLFLVTVECCNVFGSLVGIGIHGLASKKFIAYLVGAVTSTLFVALVFDPFCILYFGTTKTITMKHAYLTFWVVLIVLGVLLLSHPQLQQDEESVKNSI